MFTRSLTTEIKQLLDAYANAVSSHNLKKARRLAKQLREAWCREYSDAELYELEVMLQPLGIVDDSDIKTLRITSALACNSPSKIPATIFPVWFGTNRQPLNHEKIGEGFSYRRADTLYYGKTEVIIPDRHRPGRIGTPWWKRWLKLQFESDWIGIKDILPLSDKDFREQLTQALHERLDVNGNRHALVFLHGYNVSFNEAALRAAQLGCDLNVPGPTAFFSWPSRGNIHDYPADCATIEASEAEITIFLCKFAQTCAPAKVHLIAHSMGNRGLLRALQRIAANAQTRAEIRFGQIFLAAPDVDRRLFLSLSDLYPHFSERTTLYASKMDRAVRMSKWLHQAPRVGYLPPVTICKNIDTIAVQKFDFDLLGHGYFAESPGPLHDMFTLINSNLAPVYRQGLIAKRDTNGQYWQFNT